MVEFYDGPARLSGSASSSPYSISVNGLAAGSHGLTTAVAIDDVGLSKTSAVVHITVNTPGPTLIDFEGLDASATPAGGLALRNYLAGFGVKATNVTVGTSLVVADDFQVFLGGGRGGGVFGEQLPRPSRNQWDGVLPIVIFAALRQHQVGCGRNLLAGTAGASLPQWRAQIFDSHGNELGSVGEKRL